MKLKSIKLGTRYNSLQPFERVQFYYSDDSVGIEPMCLIGPNGSGKSNLLELIAEVFFLIDIDLKSKGKVKVDFRYSLELEYLIFNKNGRATEVRINTEKGRWAFSIKKKTHWKEISNNGEELKQYLPEKIVGYSSGMNETLSFPFSISNSEYAEEVRNAGFYNPSQRIEDSRFIFVDNDLNSSILISNYLIQPKGKLELFKEQLRIDDLEYFEIVLDFELSSKKYVKLTDEHIEMLMKLKACATTYEINTIVEGKKEQITKCNYRFVVNEATKAAFQYNFDNDPFLLFSSLRKLDLLNQLKLKKKYRYVSGKGLEQIPPKVGHEEKVFRLQEVKLRITKPPIVIPYIGISDGEHQFIQVIGSLMLFRQSNALFLMDEPETHFNPDWRSKLVRIIHDVSKNRPQEMLLTTHSPFVVSDCKGFNVFKFRRENETTTFAPIGIETFGASINIILKEVFGKQTMISELARLEIEEALETNSLTKLRETYNEVGDSRDRDLILEKINKILLKRKKN